jgi:UDP-2,3-diacylglucosamine hydrolase
MPETRFIADLHLDPATPELIEQFLDYLLICEQADLDALYILGDLFEVWLGDDCSLEEYPSVVKALKRAVSCFPVLVMHGNRDFLLGAQFVAQTGITLLSAEQKLSLYDREVLLMHGDTLCTEDDSYQKFRSMVRSAHWQQEFLMQSVQERKDYAQRLRLESKRQAVQKSAEIMDVTSVSVMACFREHQVQALIHGHTHRPAMHRVHVDGQSCQRIVVGDWRVGGVTQVLHVSLDRGYQLLDLQSVLLL